MRIRRCIAACCSRRVGRVLTLLRRLRPHDRSSIAITSRVRLSKGISRVRNDWQTGAASGGEFGGNETVGSSRRKGRHRRVDRRDRGDGARQGQRGGKSGAPGNTGPGDKPAQGSLAFARATSPSGTRRGAPSRRQRAEAQCAEASPRRHRGRAQQVVRCAGEMPAMKALPHSIA